MWWIIEGFILLALFVWTFLRLLRMEPARFKRLKRLAQIFLGITAFCLAFLLIDSAFGFLFLFFAVFAALTGASYYAFLKRSQKVGFIGLSFCMTFCVLFTYLHFFLLNFDM